MIAIVLIIGAFVALAAWMAHGDEGSWFEGTLTHVGMLVGAIGVILAVAWVATYGT